MSTPLNILIVDSDKSSRKTLYQALTDSTYPFIIKEASTIEEALAELSKKLPDCLLVTYHLSDGTGIKLHNICFNDKEFPLPMILLYEEESEELARHAIHQGIQEFVEQKAITSENIRRIILFAIERHNFQNDLEGAIVSKNQFLANISHELRTPLSDIISLSDCLSQTPLDEQQNEYVELIDQSARKLLSTVSNLVDFSMAESFTLELRKVRFSLKSLLQEIFSQWEEEAEKKGISFSYQLSNNLPDEISSDDYHLKKIIAELLSNAFKFNAAGSEVTLSARREDSTTKQLLLFSIKDNGIGIPKNKQATIFESFVLVDNSLSRDAQGIGLGLALVAKLVKALGGEIWVESAPHQGATFFFTIDTSLPPEQVSCPLPQAIHSSRLDFSKPLQILIVEDNPINQKVTSSMLEKLGHSTIIAKNGKEALTFFESKAIDLIFMDIQMPVMDGFETTAEIRAKEKERGSEAHTPIIAMTAHGTKGYREKCLSQGMDEYITKPVTQRNIRYAMGSISH